MRRAGNISELLGGQTVIPVVVIDNEHQAINLAQALLAGGVSVIEITLRNAFGLKAISLIKERFPEMLVLAGTVNTEDDMHDVSKAGCDGVISPGLTPALLESANELNLPYMPGVATGSEILTAIEHGLTECKLFPATVVGGIPALKAFAGPFAEMSFCPTGGVGVDDYQEYLALKNVICVGGSWLAPTSLVEAGEWQSITDLCMQITSPANN